MAELSTESGDVLTAVEPSVRQETVMVELPSEPVSLNLGPQHPATHGVLRIKLILEGERVTKAIPILGYLHRGKEKHGEHFTYTQQLTMIDRLDYTASLCNNFCYMGAIEKLMGLELPPRAQAIRVITFELQRIAAHLIAIGTAALDLGAFSVFLHAFRERERIYDVFNRLTGFRMNNTYARIGGVACDLDEEAVEMITGFTDDFPRRVDGYETLLTNNPIWIERNRGVGVISGEDGLALGLTGPNLRGSGVEWDLRKAQPCWGYDQYEFDVPTGSYGDCYDRYAVRIEELRQSNRIVRQATERLPDGPYFVHSEKAVLPPKDKVYGRMEELIHQFKIVVDGPTPPPGEVYFSTENPKGELGFYLVSRGDRSAYRMRIRSPSFINLQAIPKLVEGRLLADVIAIVASLDPVMGEVDR